METRIQWIANQEKNLFSDAWSVAMLKDTLQYDYNYIAVVFEEAGVTKCSLIEDCHVSPNDLRGYLIINNVAGTSELLRIGIDMQFRKKGYATCLMNWYFEHISGERYLLEVRANNVNARSLYEKFGYKRIGTRRNYYSNPTEDGMIYERFV